MTNTYSIGEFAFIIDTDYARKWNRVGQNVEISNVKVEEFDYQVKFEDGSTDLFNDDELAVVEYIEVVGNPLIINSPTFNLDELSLGSLIFVNKRYLQLQGFVAAITPKVLSIGYYDDQSNYSKCSIETIKIEDVVSGKQTIELIRKAIPLELQGT